MQIKWLRRAERDLDAVEAHIAQDNPQAAIRVVLRIINVVSLLSEQPGIGRPGRIDGTKELVVSDTSYIVPYRVKGNIIQILRVLHGAMKRPKNFK